MPYNITSVLMPSGTPFVILNTCSGALMAYGLAGMRNEVGAILIWMAIMSLHALVSNQLLVTCIWLTPTQVTLIPKAWHLQNCSCQSKKTT